MKQIFADLQVLTGISEADYATIAAHSTLTQSWIDDVVEAFYDTLFGYEKTSKVFPRGEAERPDREQTLRRWYMQVTSGNINEAFWWQQWLVGLIHIKVKVSNTYMLGMTSKVQQLFLEKCMTHLDSAEALKLYGAFKRVTDVVATLIAEGYFVNYVESLENVLGFNRGLIERMMEIEITKRIANLRSAT
ncbi:MAG: globin [Deferribacteres bacterium]|nr:globin [candidate division KSB1 bacterium]MCB9501019.1 globin [Deferribacteres bacterium]